MKCIILAAGYATRLYPLTKERPKPLIPVAGKPIINHTIEKINLLPDINEIFIVTNNNFYPHFLEWNVVFENRIPIKILNDKTTSNEDRLGAIGDIQFVIEKEQITDDILIVGGDNLFDDNLTELVQFFKQNGSTILVHDVKNRELAKLYGIVTVNSERRIIKFVEKPERPESTLASTLVYALQKEHLAVLQEVIGKGIADRSGDFIRYLSENKHAFALQLNGRWIDIGDLQQLEEANRTFSKK